MISAKAIQALKLTDAQLHVVISALETKQNSKCLVTLKDIDIKMFGAHRRRPGPSEVFTAVDTTAETIPGNDGTTVTEEESDWYDGDEQEEVEWMGENGAIYLMRPKLFAKARNAPGAAASVTQGAIQQFRHIPNASPKGVGKKGVMRLR